MKFSRLNFFNGKKKSNTFFVMVCIILLVLAVGLRFYYGSQKEGYHLDEIYSYEYIGGGEKVMPHWDDSLFNTWLTGEFFDNYITINDNEKWKFSRINEKTAMDVHPPLYYWLLHISTILVDDGEMNYAGGISLNILSFIISTILLYSLAFKILQNKYLTLIVCVLWGFSNASISSAIFIRMYEVMTIFILGVTLLIYYIFEKQQATYKNYTMLVIVAILGLLTQYLFLFFLIPMMLCISVIYFFRKQYKEVLASLIILLLSLLMAFAIFPAAKKHLFSSTYRTQEIVGKVTAKITDHFQIIVDRISEYNKIFNSDIYNGFLIIFVVVTIIALVKWNITVKKNNINDYLKFIFVILFTVLCWFLGSVYATAFADIRYIIPILPLVVLCFVSMVDYIISSQRLKYLFLGTLIILVFLRLFFGDIKYIETGTQQQWQENLENNEIPVIVIFPKKRTFTINAIVPYLVNKKQIYVTSEKDLLEANNIQSILENMNNESVYIYSVNKISEPNIFLKKGRLVYKFSYSYYNIYKFSPKM